jgi:hypothetical protein
MSKVKSKSVLVAFVFAMALGAGAVLGWGTKAEAQFLPGDPGGGGGGGMFCPGGRKPMCVQCVGRFCSAACYGGRYCSNHLGALCFAMEPGCRTLSN